VYYSHHSQRAARPHNAPGAATATTAAGAEPEVGAELSAQWRNTDRWPASRSHADPYIYLARSVAPGRDVVVEWSLRGRIAVESLST